MGVLTPASPATPAPTATSALPPLDALADPDTIAWLLDPADPAVRHATLVELVDRPADDPRVVESLARAMDADPIAGILRAQQPEGWWEKPGPGYATKYRGTVWQLIFLDQLRADPRDERIRRACAYVLSHTPAASGGFGASGQVGAAAPPPSAVIHCLNGNLVRALVGFGWLDDPRLERAIEWQARAITGVDVARWYATGTCGPGFACAANDGLPCAWGAVKALGGLTRIPVARRSPLVTRAIEAGVAFLLSRDPVAADYPAGWGNVRPSGTWFKLGFPSTYVADVLENLAVLVDAGAGDDPRLGDAVAWLRDQRDARGRWVNRRAWNHKTWIDIEAQGAPSKWLTIRALRVLRATTSVRPIAVPAASGTA